LPRYLYHDQARQARRQVLLAHDSAIVHLQQAEPSDVSFLLDLAPQELQQHRLLDERSSRETPWTQEAYR